jgi:hypothetical protein
MLRLPNIVLVAGAVLLPGGAGMAAEPVAGAMSQTRGTLVHYTLTPKGDVDGFVLADGTEIEVSPRLSTALVFTARPGDKVTVQWRKRPDRPLVEAAEIRNDATGAVLLNEGPKGRPEAEPAQVTGKVQFSLHGPKGDLNGAMLEDGTVLRLPPKEALRAAAQLAPGQPISAKGRMVTTPMGRVVEVNELD